MQISAVRFGEGRGGVRAERRAPIKGQSEAALVKIEILLTIEDPAAGSLTATLGKRDVSKQR